MLGALKKEKLLNSINLINETINTLSVLVFKIKIAIILYKTLLFKNT